MSLWVFWVSKLSLGWAQLRKLLSATSQQMLFNTFPLRFKCILKALQGTPGILPLIFCRVHRFGVIIGSFQVTMTGKKRKNMLMPSNMEQRWCKNPGAWGNWQPFIFKVILKPRCFGWKKTKTIKNSKKERKPHRIDCRQWKTLSTRVGSWQKLCNSKGCVSS